MSILDNYESLADKPIRSGCCCNSVPETVDISYNKIIPITFQKPYKEIDTTTNNYRYYWYYGDTIVLRFNLSDESTMVVDGKSFATLEDYLIDKLIVVDIYNFRKEPLDFAQRIFRGADGLSVSYLIDRDLSDKLLRGIYYCSLKIVGQDITTTVIPESNCVLVVK